MKLPMHEEEAKKKKSKVKRKTKIYKKGEIGRA
jgi:hypothetical protein